ncbi:MAG: hypothetical protein J3R72DRAFT_491774 [Linnemannia gamsii]|nr:MAG: hypothetical protein J3R72DRAFT_491774 [Linnemannia gamsii]
MECPMLGSLKSAVDVGIDVHQRVQRCQDRKRFNAVQMGHLRPKQPTHSTNHVSLQVQQEQTASLPPLQLRPLVPSLNEQRPTTQAATKMTREQALEAAMRKSCPEVPMFNMNSSLL